MTSLARTPTLPQERLWLWRLGFPIVSALAGFLCPWRLEGAENVPPSGAFILVSNHINWKDPPWIEFALGRAIRYMAKRELFELPVIGYVLRGIGAFPVRRGEADRGALQMALAVLSAGQPLGFFPEGHRSESGQLLRARPGVAFIAQHSDAPIIPFAVTGTKDARLGRFWRRDIVFRAGTPFRVRDLGLGSDDPQATADAIMRRVAGLLPPDMRGAYPMAETSVGQLVPDHLRPKSVEGPKFQLASSEQTERAREAIDEFLDAVVPQEERPYIVTDMASVFDVTSLSSDEIKERCLRAYGVRPSEEDLVLPLWRLMERLKRSGSGSNPS